MSIKLNTARRFLETNGVQLSEEAVEEFCDYLNGLAEATTTQTLVSLDEENILRRVQGLPPLRRILPRHVMEAVENGR